MAYFAQRSAECAKEMSLSFLVSTPKIIPPKGRVVRLVNLSPRPITTPEERVEMRRAREARYRAAHPGRIEENRKARELAKRMKND